MSKNLRLVLRVENVDTGETVIPQHALSLVFDDDMAVAAAGLPKLRQKLSEVQHIAHRSQNLVGEDEAMAYAAAFSAVRTAESRPREVCDAAGELVARWLLPVALEVLVQE